MKSTKKNYLWILVTNGLLIATVAILFHLKATTSVFGEDDVNVEVANPVLNGDMARMQIFEPRKTMPSLKFLHNLEDEQDLSELKGQWTLVNLWATWCAPCIKELPSLQKLNDDYEGDGFRVIAISMDVVQDTTEIQGFVKSKKLGDIAMNWDHKGDIFRTLPQDGIPVSYIIGPRGKVYGFFKGDTDWSSPDAHAFVDSLLTTSK